MASSGGGAMALLKVCSMNMHGQVKESGGVGWRCCAFVALVSLERCCMHHLSLVQHSR